MNESINIKVISANMASLRQDFNSSRENKQSILISIKTYILDNYGLRNYFNIEFFTIYPTGNL